VVPIVADAHGLDVDDAEELRLLVPVDGHVDAHRVIDDGGTVVNVGVVADGAGGSVGIGGSRMNVGRSGARDRADRGRRDGRRGPCPPVAAPLGASCPRMRADERRREGGGRDG